MKQLAILLLLLLNTLKTFGQEKYEPQILILSPNETMNDKEFQKEINSINKRLKNYKDPDKEEYMKSSDFMEKSKNIRSIVESEYNYSKNLDLFKLTSYISEQHLSYVFFRKFPNLMIQLSELKSNGESASLKDISEKHQFQYILNFPKIELYKENKQKFARITVQLYDHLTNKIVVNKTYIGDWSNPGFEFTCEDESLNCTINNALSQALSDIIKEIASNNSTIISERKLQQDREHYLTNEILNKPYDNHFLSDIIIKNNLGFDPSKSFQCIVNNDQSMFVALFVENKEFSKDNGDKNVNITTRDGSFSNLPDNYGYTLSGLKYQDKWYFEKTNVSYFPAADLAEARKIYIENLIKMNYFIKNSSEVNPEFWNSNSFERVDSELIKHKDDIERYKLKISNSNDPEMIEMYKERIEGYYQREEEIQEYIGQYKLVVDELKTEKKKTDSLYFLKIKTTVLDKYFESIKSKEKTETVETYDSPLILIYPSDKSIFIAPAITKLKDEHYDLNFYVVIPAENNQYELYKWTYINTIHVKGEIWITSEIQKNIDKITSWNYSYAFLNNPDFWKNYVLLKENDQFKYLQKVN